MNRNEHVEWCKQRALIYIEKGELNNALASMGSDLNKYVDTENHPGMQIGMMLLATGQLNSNHKMREFINGFH